VWPAALLFGSKPELLQDAQVVVTLPLLNYLAVLDAVYGDAFELDPLAGGRTILLSLSLVSGAYGVSAYHLVAFGYDVLDDNLRVGEGAQSVRDLLLTLLDAADVLVGFVTDKVGGVNFLYEVQVIWAHDLPSTACQGLVLFYRHMCLSFPYLLH
jgi:hypothetical protein